MMLFVCILILLYLSATHAPATADARRARQRYFENRARQNQWFREEARKHDYYYREGCFGYDETFYSDGSVRIDPQTGKHHAKGKYYARSNGLTATYDRSNTLPRAPK